MHFGGHHLPEALSSTQTLRVREGSRVPGRPWKPLWGFPPREPGAPPRAARALPWQMRVLATSHPPDRSAWRMPTGVLIAEGEVDHRLSADGGQCQGWGPGPGLGPCTRAHGCQAPSGAAWEGTSSGVACTAHPAGPRCLSQLRAPPPHPSSQ